MLRDAGFDLVHELDLACAPVTTSLRRGLLIANTRALWPRFLAAWRVDPMLRASPDPLDLYTEQTIAQAFPGAPAWFAHRAYDGAFLPFQRIAVAAGLGALAPTQLVIHPIYGPWFGLRALVALPGEPVVTPPLPTYRCTGACEALLTEAMRGGDWRAWLAVRDACTVGRAHRYDEDQLAYHYTKDRELLI